MGRAGKVQATDFNGKKLIKLRPASPKFRALLSIDGGGVRGIIPAIVMGGFVRAAKEVLRETYPECADLSDDDMIIDVKDCFDTVAGNSAGSILALYFASGGGRPDMYEKGGRLEGYYPGSTDAIVHEFDQLVNTIFKPPSLGWISAIRKLSAVFSSMYGSRGLEQGLDEVFGNITLQDLKMNTYIPAYELNNSRPVGFYCRKRSNGKLDTGYSFPRNPSHEDTPEGSVEEIDAAQPDAQRPASMPPNGNTSVESLPSGNDAMASSMDLPAGVFPEHFKNTKLNIPVKIVAQASSSAPVYFSSTNVDQEEAGINVAKGDKTVSWVDGGVVSNNPTIQALAFMASAFYDRKTGARFPTSRMAVLSIGTGTAKTHCTVSPGKDGVARWLSCLVTVLMNSHLEVNHSIVDALFDGTVFGATHDAHDRYVRINRVAYVGDKDHETLRALDAVDKIPDLKKIGEDLVKESWDTMKNFIKNVLLVEEE